MEWSSNISHKKLPIIHWVSVYLVHILAKAPSTIISLIQSNNSLWFYLILLLYFWLKYIHDIDLNWATIVYVKTLFCKD